MKKFFPIILSLLLTSFFLTENLSAQELLGTDCKNVTTFENKPNSIDITYRGKNNIPYGSTASANPQKFNLIVYHYPYTSKTCDLDFDVAYGQKFDPSRGGYYGYHFYIGRDGKIIQGAPMNKRTNHVDAKFPKINIGYNNNSSVGITLSCGQNGAAQAQVDSAVKVGHALQIAYGIPSGRIFGHGEIQTTKNIGEGSPAQQTARSKSPDASGYTINYTLENGEKRVCTVSGPVPAGCTPTTCNVSTATNNNTDNGPLGNLMNAIGLSNKPNVVNDNQDILSDFAKDQDYLKPTQTQNPFLPNSPIPQSKPILPLIPLNNLQATPTKIVSNPACLEVNLNNTKARLAYYLNLYNKNSLAKFGSFDYLLKNSSRFSFSFEYFFAQFYAKQIQALYGTISNCTNKN